MQGIVASGTDRSIMTTIVGGVPLVEQSPTSERGRLSEASNGSLTSLPIKESSQLTS
jgi:hypothetical protein